MKYSEVIHFWFEELSPQDWWKKSDNLDNQIKQRFLDLHKSAAAGELFHWRSEADGRLAEIIVLDQFSRNIFRDQPQAFAHDGMALALSQEAVSNGIHNEFADSKLSFLIMPYMHSESPKIHEIAMDLFSAPGLESNLDFEKKHKQIIDRFGRYPHRNKILGRTSTPEETEFLKQKGSSF